MREVAACRRRRRRAAAAAKRRQPRDWLFSLTVSDSFAAEVFFPDSRQERREEPKDYAT